MKDEDYSPWRVNGQGAAFPTHAYNGLTKREYVACVALQGLLAERGNCGDELALVRLAIATADVLLAELEP